MSKSKKRSSRYSIRKTKVYNKDKLGLFLFGRLNETYRAVGYCKLHKCYLEPKDIAEKRCKKKNCKYLKEKEQ